MMSTFWARAALVSAGVALAVALGLVIFGPTSPSPLRTERTPPPPTRGAAGQRGALPLFSPESFWNQRVDGDVLLDPSSSALVGQLSREIDGERRQGIVPWIATATGSTRLYTVPRDQPTVRVNLTAQGVVGGPALQQALRAVPIPAGAVPAQGPDHHMSIWQPSTDRLWELFEAHRTPGGWDARWGGAIKHASTFPGYFTSAAWPGATPNWGATATSLPVIGGVMLISELRQGHINHALALNLATPRSGQFAWPAQRSDGTGGPSEIPEGAHLRLDPKLNLDTLNLPPLGRMIAEAAQRYGLVVRDQTHHGVSLFAQDPGPGGRGVYYESGFYHSLDPGQILERFPWDRLQVLKMQLCSTAPCHPG